MTFEIKRSPARQSWMVMCNGQMVMTACTKREAQEIVDKFKRTYL